MPPILLVLNSSKKRFQTGLPKYSIGIFTRCNLLNTFMPPILQQVLLYAITLQNFIYMHTADSEKVLEKEKGEQVVGSTMHQHAR